MIEQTCRKFSGGNKILLLVGNPTSYVPGNINSKKHFALNQAPVPNIKQKTNADSSPEYSCSPQGVMAQRLSVLGLVSLYVVGLIRFVPWTFSIFFVKDILSWNTLHRASFCLLSAWCLLEAFVSLFPPGSCPGKEGSLITFSTSVIPRSSIPVQNSGVFIV